MKDNRLNDFFYPGNAVHGEPDYGLAENFMRTDETLINALYYKIKTIQHKYMKTLSFAIILLILCVPFELYAKKKKIDYPRAEIKVSYNYHHLALNNDGEIKTRDYDYMLLANLECSKYFNHKNEYIDSLKSTPQGRKLHHQLITIGLDQYRKNGDSSAVPSYKGQLYVFKSLKDMITTVYDKYGLVEQGVYEEPFIELNWTVEDSTKTILGYECIMAETDYHGRHWIAWFSPEIPLSDGPWKLCGLPGLILEASESTGQHSFRATGIENCNQVMYPIYQPNRYSKMKRIDMLKAYSEYRKNASSISRALLLDAPDGSRIEMDAPKQQKLNTKNIDFLETDYHE